MIRLLRSIWRTVTLERFEERLLDADERVQRLEGRTNGRREQRDDMDLFDEVARRRSDVE